MLQKHSGLEKVRCLSDLVSEGVGIASEVLCLRTSVVRAVN